MNADLLKIIKILNELNLYKNVILIGSWVEYFYSDLIENYQSQFVTQDIDFLIQRPVKAGNGFISEMKKIGFEYSEDYITHKSKFYKDNIEVEFLTNLTRDQMHICSISTMGINAESLSSLDILLNNTILVHEDDLCIKIPSPSAYCIHKLLINPKRVDWKKQKDIDSIILIFSRMLQANVYLDDTKRIFNNLSKKQQDNVIKVVEKYNIIEFYKIINNT